jgi:hypothetical protein
MAQLYLPAEHTEADLVLAGQIAETVASAELYVTWTPAHGQAAPEVCAELREPESSWPSMLLAAIRDAWAALRNREPAHRLAPPPHPAGQPETAA